MDECTLTLYDVHVSTHACIRVCASASASASASNNVCGASISCVGYRRRGCVGTASCPLVDAARIRSVVISCVHCLHTL